MASVQFDSTEIINTTYRPRFIQHETVADRNVASSPLAREDGDVFISERYGPKRIALSGVIVGTSEADLESKIDTFKELFSRTQKNLDISWNGGTRRYVATCTRHNFDRDYYHTNMVPWTADFIVPSGVGTDTTTTTALNERALTTTTPATDSFTLVGSKAPKPLITIKGNSATSSIRGIEYKNTDTGEKLVVTLNTSLWSTDSFFINCLTSSVTQNITTSPASAIYSFYGVFPTFKIGTNNVLITLGGIVNQSTSDTSAPNTTGISIANSTHKFAQSFTVPYDNDTFQGVVLALDKTGNPSVITWRIETDDGGNPSGTLAHANATGTIPDTDATTVSSYVTNYSSNVWSLSANTVYWLVAYGPSVDGSNYYNWYLSNNSDYTRGRAKRTTSGAWTDNDIAADKDYSFRILFGGKPDTSGVKHSVVYTPTYL